MSNFRPVDRETGFLLPPSVEEWLPERHLARFVVEVIEQLDLSAFVKAYRGSGSASYHPSMLLGLLVYGYATGVFSSRKLERATYDSVAFRFIAANDHPDHDTIAAFRRRFLDRIEGLFVEVLLLAREAGVLKLGTVALDGTKVHAKLRHRLDLALVAERGLITPNYLAHRVLRNPHIPGDLLDRNAPHQMFPTDPCDRLHNQHLPHLVCPNNEVRSRSQNQGGGGGAILDADYPTKGGNIPRRSTGQRPRRTGHRRPGRAARAA